MLCTHILVYTVKELIIYDVTYIIFIRFMYKKYDVTHFYIYIIQI